MVYITSQKLNELKEELKKRKTIVRRRISKRIQDAQEQGDITENAEYAEAKEEQAFNEGRILELENLVRNAEIIQKKQKKDIVEVGNEVVLEGRGKVSNFVIVGPEDADLSKKKISNESPIGRAIIGHRKGDEVEVQTPGGKVKYKIKDIK